MKFQITVSDPLGFSFSETKLATIGSALPLTRFLLREEEEEEKKEVVGVSFDLSSLSRESGSWLKTKEAELSGIKVTIPNDPIPYPKANSKKRKSEADTGDEKPLLKKPKTEPPR